MSETKLYKKLLPKRIGSTLSRAIPYVKTMLGRNTLSTINKLNIEICARCNLHCKYCALDSNRPQEFLLPMYYEKLMNEILDSGYTVKELCLSHSGEVLQHPHFEEFLTITKRYKDKGGTGTVHINSNMVLLTPDRIDKLLDYNVVDVIVCSIDGRDKFEFELLRPPARYETVMKNLKYLLSYDKEERPKIWWNNGQLPNVECDTNILSHEINPDMFDEFTMYNYHSWGGQIDSQENDSASGFCRFVFHLVLTASGHIAKCCYDLNGHTVYGDFKQDSLKDIYHSRRRKSDLTKMALRLRTKVEGCRGCTIR